MDMVIERAKKIKQGCPLDMDTMIGAQASQQQLDKILDELGENASKALLKNQLTINFQLSTYYFKMYVELP